MTNAYAQSGVDVEAVMKLLNESKARGSLERAGMWELLVAGGMFDL